MSIYHIKEQDGTIYELDATVEISYRSSGKATDNPVESGASVADHFVNNPDQISLSGFISSTKSFAANNENVKTPEDFINNLRRIKNNGSPVTLHYGEDVGNILNCVIEDITIVQNQQKGTKTSEQTAFLSAYQINISLKQIQFARAAIIETARDQDFVDDYGEKRSASGSTTEPEDQEEVDRKEQGVELILQGITGELQE